MSTRIYAVTNTGSAVSKTRLVRATSSGAARNHIAKDVLRVTIPSQETLLACGKDGVTVEETGEPATAEPAMEPTHE